MPWRWRRVFVSGLISPLLWATIQSAPVAASDSVAPATSAGPRVHSERVELIVVPRSQELRNFPCSMCHQFVPPNPEPRALSVTHPPLEHGDGELWCGACHNMETPDTLSSGIIDGVDFDHAHLVCGRCHAPQLDDWQYGGHSRRVDSSQGNRELYGCVHCHDPHAPAIKPRRPQPPPPVRAGLARPENRSMHPTRPLWERADRTVVEFLQDEARGVGSWLPHTTSFPRLTAGRGKIDEE